MMRCLLWSSVVTVAVILALGGEYPAAGHGLLRGSETPAVNLSAQVETGGNTGISRTFVDLAQHLRKLGTRTRQLLPRIRGGKAKDGVEPEGPVRGVAEDRAAAPETFFIETRRPELRDFQLDVSWLGWVVWQSEVKVIAPESGRVESIDVQDGDEVSVGSAMFILGGPQITSAMEATKSRISFLERRLAIAEEATKRKREALARQITSRDELETAEDRLLQIQGELEAATRKLQTLQERTRVRAPAKGTVRNRAVSVGQEVEKGTVLAEVVDLTHLRIVATLFPPTATTLQGRTAVVDGKGGQTVQGTVTRVLPERTREGGTVVWIEGEQINNRLKPGEGASGEIVLETHQASLSVPRGAVVYDEREVPYVFVRGAGGYAKQRVQTGLASAGWVEILTGISYEDQVVTLGAYELLHQDFSKVYKVAD